MYYPSLFNGDFCNDLFDEVLNFPFDYGKRIRNEVLQKKRCTTDIKEFSDRYELDMELPGYAKDEVKAELKNGYLVVSAEHKELKDNTKPEDEKAAETPAEDAAAEAEGDAQDTADAKVETGKVETNDQEPKYIVKERFYGKTERSFYVGKEVSKEDIKAQFINGILTITIPKVVKKPDEDGEYISIIGE